MNQLERAIAADGFRREQRRLQKNQPRPPRGESGYRGVSRCGKRWRAQHMVGGQTKYIACYDTAMEAAIAVDEANALAGKIADQDYNFPFLR